jgi:hypothetical protein
MRHTEFGSGMLEAAAAGSGFEGANRIQGWKKSALRGWVRHRVSFSDLTSENNSIVDRETNVQIGLSEIFPTVSPITAR